MSQVAIPPAVYMAQSRRLLSGDNALQAYYVMISLVSKCRGAAKKRIIVTFNISIEHQTLNGMNYETGLTWSLSCLVTIGIVLNTTVLLSYKKILSIFAFRGTFFF